MALGAAMFYSPHSSMQSSVRLENHLLFISISLAMSHNLLRLIKLLEVFLFLVRQCLPLCLDSLVHPLDTAEADNGACASFVDPRQRDLTYLPASFLCNFLYTDNDFLVNGRSASASVILL